MKHYKSPWPAQECDRLRAAADRAAWQRPGFCYKVALHTLLAGDRRAVDALLRVASRLVASLLHATC